MLPVTASSLLQINEKIIPDAVNWKFFWENSNKLLAADSTASYSLMKMAESITEPTNTLVFHSHTEKH